MIKRLISRFRQSKPYYFILMTASGVILGIIHYLAMVGWDNSIDDAKLANIIAFTALVFTTLPLIAGVSAKNLNISQGVGYRWAIKQPFIHQLTWFCVLAFIVAALYVLFSLVATSEVTNLIALYVSVLYIIFVLFIMVRFISLLTKK